MRSLLSVEEYSLLSDQKAADYRSFVQLNPGLLAVTGAVFAAGLSQKSTVAIVLSPLPLLLAVFQLVRNAELQLELTTYLAVFAPTDAASWERDIAEVRPRYWANEPKRLASIRRASGWNVWILASLVITETLVAFPWMSGFSHGDLAFVVASMINAAVHFYLFGTGSRIEKKRERWRDLWRSYLEDGSIAEGHSDETR